jgi:co-chaperonin GroES (HSP10)
MEINLKNNYVLTKEIIEKEKVSSGGIILPSEKYNRKCIVIKSSSEEVREGQTVIKTIGKGTIFRIDGEEYEALHENHILGIIEEDGTET